MQKKLLIILLLGLISISCTGCLPWLFPEPNNPPVITPIPNATVIVGEAFTYPVEATDPDEDDLTYSLITNPSTDMSIDENSGVISWTPTAIGSYYVTVEVSDGDMSNIQSFTITVSPVPVGPTVVSLLPLEATVGESYTGQVTATPGSNATLAYSLVGAPSGMIIVAATGAISWTPTAAGDQAVTIVVTDGAGLSDSKDFTIIVSPANHPPVITSTAVTSAIVGGTYTYAVEATDPDGDTLTYSLTACPAGMNIDENSGIISWTPTTVGNFGVTVKVSGGELTDTQSFTVTVNPSQKRVVMWELFEGPACSRCKAIHSDIVQLRQEYGLDELVILEEYGWDTSDYTGWGIKDVRDRYYDYLSYVGSDKGGFPAAFFNGINPFVYHGDAGYTNYKAAIEKELAKPAKIAISASYNATGKIVNISGNITNISSGTLNNLVVEAMVYEDSVYSEYRKYNVDHVVRDIITYTESGENISSLSSGNNYQFSLTSSYLSNVHKMKNIHVVVYVQAPNSPTKEILQALYVE